MPRLAIDYSNTHFYRIVCKDLSITNCYVGHTTDFRVRKNAHKSQCHNLASKYYNLPVYQFRENGGWYNWDMILIATQSCENKLMATMKERQYIEQFEASLNSYIPSRSVQERSALRKDEIAQYMKQYHEEHKEEHAQKRRQYIQKHQQETNDYNHRYYKQSKEKLKEKVVCHACGGLYSRTHRSMHEKTKKHQQALN